MQSMVLHLWGQMPGDWLQPASLPLEHGTKRRGTVKAFTKCWRTSCKVFASLFPMARGAPLMTCSTVVDRTDRYPLVIKTVCVSDAHRPCRAKPSPGSTSRGRAFVCGSGSPGRRVWSPSAGVTEYALTASLTGFDPPLGHSSLEVGTVPRSGEDFARLRVTHLNRRLSRESWLIAVQPISFMSRSISVCIRPSARSTPAWPAAAKG
jgi:hypothetical protein